jgi:hypothetical protein
MPNCHAQAVSLRVDERRLHDGLASLRAIRRVRRTVPFRGSITMKSILRATVVLLALCSAGRAQCLDWSSEFIGSGLNYSVHAQAVFDDGSGGGPQLYVAGASVNTTPGVLESISRWDGAAWQSIPNPPGVPAFVSALEIFDDGSGAALYAGGANWVGRWNGIAWSMLPGFVWNDEVHDLAVFDDGGGPALYAAGYLRSAGGTPVYGIAKWNGATWSAIGASIAFGSTGFPIVYSLLEFDDGSGPALFAAGHFNQIDGLNARNVAKWNGSSWSMLSTGLNPTVYALCVFDDGSGPSLYAGGSFQTLNNQAAGGIAKWSNGVWSTVGTGLTSASVNAMQVFDDGFGEQLYVGGKGVSIASSATHGIARWNGAVWSTPTAGDGIECSTCAQGAVVESFAQFDDGTGLALYAAGTFERVDQAPANNVARLDANGWTALGDDNAPSGHVAVLHVFDDGTGPALYLGGAFEHAGPAIADSIARWNGTTWSSVGSGGLCDGAVLALADFDDGTGPALYAGGNFGTIDGVSARRLAKFDGATWSEVGGGFLYTGPVPTSVTALAVYDDGTGPALFVGGRFLSAGGVYAPNIAKWDGANWSPLGSGSSVPQSMVVFDDGSGPQLYVTGGVGSVPAAFGLARWNGTSWSSVGGSLSNGSGAQALAVHDDGTGPALYAAGYFTLAGTTNVHYIARWDGATWTDVGGGFSSNPATLGVFDDGSGPALYAGGFESAIASGTVMLGISRWNGATWEPVRSGLTGTRVQIDLYAGFAPLADSMAVFDDGSGSGPALFVGGSIVEADGHTSSNLAKWGRACTCPPASYCTAGTTTHGCVAQIASSGAPSASASSGFLLTVSGTEGASSGLIFYGTSGPIATPWGNGASFLCVKSPLQRMNFQAAGGAQGQCGGLLSTDWNAFYANHPASVGHPFVAGMTCYAQGWFRDPPAPKTTSLSDALSFAVCP